MRGPLVAGVTWYGLVVVSVVHWANGSATLVDPFKVPVPVHEIVNCPLLKTSGLNTGGTDA
jgi:hypothetical protein